MDRQDETKLQVVDSSMIQYITSVLSTENKQTCMQEHQQSCAYKNHNIVLYDIQRLWFMMTKTAKGTPIAPRGL